MLLDGQLRWEAARSLGWESIRAVIAPVPKDLNHNSLITFLHFEDLNPLDKAEAIIQEIIKVTGLKIDEVQTILATVLKRIERDGNSKKLAELVIETTEEQQKGIDALGAYDREREILAVLLDLGLNPGSVKSNLLPMLTLSSDLKIAIRQQGLKGAHALLLAALSAKTLSLSEHKAMRERVSATQKVLEEKFSVTETRRLVAEIKSKFSKSEPDTVATSFQMRMKTVTKVLQKSRIWEDAQKRDRLESIFSDLEALIGEYM